MAAKGPVPIGTMNQLAAQQAQAQHEPANQLARLYFNGLELATIR